MNMSHPPGWMYAEGDPAGTHRYWDGTQWLGEPLPAPIANPVAAVNPLVENAPAGMALADPWKRVGARLLDWLLLVVVMWTFGLVGSVAVNLGDLASSTETILVLGLFGVVAIASFLWDALWVHFAEATPAKLLLKLRVVRADGNPAAGVPAFLRALSRVVWSIPLLNYLLSPIIALVSLILMFTDSQHRTVMDRLAGTIVVDR